MDIYRTFVKSLASSADFEKKWLFTVNKAEKLSEKFTALTYDLNPNPWSGKLSTEEAAARIIYYLVKEKEAFLEINLVPHTYMTLVVKDQRHILDKRLPYLKGDLSFVIDGKDLTLLDQVLLGKAETPASGAGLMDRLFRIVFGIVIDDIQSLLPEDFVLLTPWIYQKVRETKEIPMLPEVRKVILNLLTKASQDHKFGWFDPHFKEMLELVSDDKKFPPLITRSKSPTLGLVDVESDMVELGLPSSPRGSLPPTPEKPAKKK